MWMLLTLLWSPLAAAGPVEDALSEARVAIEDAEFEKARTVLDGARESAAASAEIVVTDSLARIEYYMGIVEYYNGDPDQGALGYWRKALILSLDFSWDTTLVAEQDARDIFEALRSEVRQKPQIATGAPEEEIEGLRIYIDGKLVYAYDHVIEGRHLIQVLCPDQSLRGMWADFGEPPDYLAVCGIEGGEGGEKEREKKEREPRDRGEGPSALQIGLWSGGGALVLGGTAVYFLTVNPAYGEIDSIREAPADASRAEADEATATFNRWRAVDLILLGGGIAAGTTGFFVGDQWALVPAGPGALVVRSF